MSGLVLAPIIAIAVLLGIAGILAMQQGRQRHLKGRVVQRSVLRNGLPTILFFTGASCHICHTAQKPALQALSESVGTGFIFEEIDVAIRPEMARAYRVMTLPTTVVLDSLGTVKDINVGFAPADKLREQLAGAGLAVAA